MRRIDASLARLLVAPSEPGGRPAPRAARGWLGALRSLLGI
jgi:hypothetical protein